MSDEDTPLFDWAGPARHLARPGRRPLAHHREPGRRSPASTPTAQWDVRRFRPTGLIETTGRTGYAEEGWTTIELGEVAVEVLMPTMRCSMPSRAQPGLDRDKAIGTTIRDAQQQQPGRLRLGHAGAERSGWAIACTATVASGPLSG